MVVARVATLNPSAKRVSRRDVRLNAVNAKSSNVYPLTDEGLTEAIERLMFS